MKYGIVCLAAVVIGAASCGGDESSAKREADPDGSATRDAEAEGASGGGGGPGDSGATGGTAGMDADASAFDGDGPSGDGDLGSECDADADCQSGFCLDVDSSELAGGGPAGGLCAIACFEGGQALCDAEAPGSACVRVDDEFAICLESCVPGPGSLAEAECHGRTDVACIPDSPGALLGTCQPTCENDSQCGDRVCDIGLGVCVDEADRPDGLPVGSECDPDEDECAGFCRTFSGDINMCTGVCNRSVIACLSEADAPADAACLFTFDTAAAQDIGLCGQLCDATDDCAHPALRCVEFNASTQELTGRQGYCTSSAEPSGDAGIPEGGAPEAGRAEAGAPDAPAPEAGSADTGTRLDAAID